MYAAIHVYNHTNYTRLDQTTNNDLNTDTSIIDNHSNIYYTNA